MATKKTGLTSSSARARAKSLRANADHVRTSIPATGVPLIEAMGRAMRAYVEFPVRLMKCNSPAQLWIEYLRFGQVLFSSFEGASRSDSQAQGSRQSSERPARRKQTKVTSAGSGTTR